MGQLLPIVQEHWPGALEHNTNTANHPGTLWRKKIVLKNVLTNQHRSQCCKTKKTIIAQPISFQYKLKTKT